MKKLAVDMELFIELSSIDTRGEGESYLNSEDGDFSYIPVNVLEAINNNEKFEELEEWEKELFEEAKDIVENKDNKYIYIPVVDEDFTLNVMKEYTLTLRDDLLKQKLLILLSQPNFHYSFNNLLLKEGDIDSYYDFKDYRTYEYLKNWLIKNEIELIEGYK